jgi:hypothetical protein
MVSDFQCTGFTCQQYVTHQKSIYRRNCPLFKNKIGKEEDLEQINYIICSKRLVHTYSYILEYNLLQAPCNKLWLHV